MAGFVRCGLIAAILVVVAGAPLVYHRYEYTRNKRLREVVPGKVYRSGQMTAPGFADAVAEFNIRTVVNLQDDVPDQRTKSLLVRRLKQASMAQLAVRRREISDALAEVTELEFWNGGGSGSVDATAADGAVTEIAAGSGLLVPGIFDHYASFEPRPAAYFGLRVSRKPSPTIATVHGGGLIASGPTGEDRSPVPWAPPGLHLTGLEGAGEVQTPLLGEVAVRIRVGDRIYMRHAKAGELCERFDRLYLVAGEEIVAEAPTYRGEGHSFL